jgi:hypothetical protein
MLDDVVQTTANSVDIPADKAIPNVKPEPWRPSLIDRLLVGFFKAVNLFIPWYRLPRYIGLANLAAFRVSLRKYNLYHPTLDGLPPPVTTPMPAKALVYRQPDGSFNDLTCPGMGCRQSRFGRNVPFSDAHPDVPALLLSPSPRVVSERLLARTEFEPATGLNLLAAAWIQFQIHDWFSHGENDRETIDIPLGASDPWKHGNPMRVERTRKDATRTAEENRADLPPTFASTESFWWDASAIYSSNPQATEALRDPEGKQGITGHMGKLALDQLIVVAKDEAGRERQEQACVLPHNIGEKLPSTGFNTNWWLGLEILHTLFAQEHNAICDALCQDYPRWSHAQLLSTARLINAALMAKIHTVEWTPAIIARPTTELAMRTNWWGLLGEGGERVFGRLGNTLLSGIPGSETEHHGVPFTLTEEFTAVYRMHPLLPDEIIFRKLNNEPWTRTGLPEHRVTMERLIFEQSHPLLTGTDNEFGEALRIEDVFYSFGLGNPGQLKLHNYPNFLREIRVPDVVGDDRSTKLPIDLATIDILRDRERGVPRYNRMRRLLHMAPAKTFEDITPDPKWADELREVYDGDLERVDLQVGMLAEKGIEGLAFSDTAFRIFILMASRRLKSDRFFTRDFTARVYTPLGMRWIAENDMTSVLLRHYPQLAPVLSRCSNAFKPWGKRPQ